MISRFELEEINNIMIGRGRPTERDDIGYNVPDYNKLSSLWYGASDNDLFEISSRLVKYYDTQLIDMELNFDKESLVETAKYYEDIAKSMITRPSVTVAISKDNNSIYVGFKYNEDYINVMRKHKYTFDRDYKSWVGSVTKIKAILKELETLGAFITNSYEYVLDIEKQLNISISESIEEIISSQEKVLLVEKIDEEYISLEFQFDNSLVEEIKKLKYKKFDWDNKVWIISKFESKELYENIKYLGYDLKGLTPYAKSEEIPEIKVVKSNDKDTEISFPYIAKVVDNIKSLSYYKFNRANLSWTIDTREIELFIELVKDYIDCSELKEFIVEKEEQEKIDLIDYTSLKRKPFEHQVLAARFLLNNRKSILADEMGTGKTLSCILASMSIKPPRLVICPASLKYNWAKEIRMVDETGSICILGDDELDSSADWIIINYDILEKNYEELEKIAFNCVSLDEAHYIKSISNSGEPNSKRADYSIRLAEKCDYVFSLTGTPVTNKPKDIFNILRISNHILSRNFFNFAQSYCGAKHNGWGWNFDGASNTLELHNKIKPIMLRRLKKDMLELPEKIRRFIPVKINMREYENSVLEYKRNKASLKSEGEHLAYLGAIKHILAKEKVNSTLEIAETVVGEGNSIVIFTNYNAVVDKIMYHFKDISTKITGACSGRNREKAVEDFQSGRKKVMVANIMAAGVGLTLTKANHLIFNDFDWVPANHFQAEDRIHRIGQDDVCNIDYVYVNNAEIDMYMSEMLETKSMYINEIIDGGNGDQLDIMKEIITNLYK